MVVVPVVHLRAVVPLLCASSAPPSGALLASCVRSSERRSHARLRVQSKLVVTCLKIVGNYLSRDAEEPSPEVPEEKNSSPPNASEQSEVCSSTENGRKLECTH